MKAYKNLSKSSFRIILFAVASASCFFYFSSFSTSNADDIEDQSTVSIVGESDQIGISRFLSDDYRFNEDSSLDSPNFIKNTTELGSIQFNGTDSNIEIDKLFAPKVNFSIGAWIKLDELNKDQVIAAQGANGYSYDFKFGINSDNTVYLDLKTSTNQAIHTQTNYELSDLNKWYFIAAVTKYNIGTNASTVNLFIDNDIKATLAFTGISFSNVANEETTKFMIGSDIPSQNDEYLSATLDKVFIYDSSLSSIQIENWCQKSSRLLPKIVPLSGFAGLWEFESQSGTKTIDFSKYRRDGKLNNFTLSGWFTSPYKEEDLGSYGLQLDGIDDYVILDIPEDAKNQNDGTLDISFGINSFPQTDNKGVIFAVSNESDPLSFIKIYIGSDKKLHYEVQNNGSTELDSYFDSNLEENYWYHLVVRKSSSNTDFYLNGMNITMTGNTNSDIWIDDITANKITLGSFKDNINYSGFFSGNIQFIHSYPISLDQDQINHIFNNNQPSKIENIFTQYIDSSFEVDFDDQDTKLYTGDFTKTFAKLRNFTARAPPNILNPNFYDSTSIKFLNSADYLLVPNQASLKNSNEFSVGIGFKYQSSVLPASNAYLFREETSDSTERISVYLNSTGNIVCSIPDSGKNILMTSNETYADGDWHLAICSFNSITDHHKLSIDAKEVILLSKDVDSIGGYLADKIFIGSKEASNNQFIGSIDDLFIVEESLSNDHIKRINNNRKSLLYTLDSPGETYTGRWDFNETSGNFINESPRTDIDISTFNISRIQPQTNRSSWLRSKEEYNNSASVKSNHVLSFDGVDDYIEVDTTDMDKFTDIMDISVSAWIKTTDQNSYIINRKSGLGNDFALQIIDGAPILTVYGNSGNATIQSSENINNGEWHHIVAQYSQESSSIKNIYIDGGISASSTAEAIGEINSINIPLEIGANTYESSYFSGNISKITIYGEILDINEVENLYKYNKTNLDGNTQPGTKFYMPLNEGNGYYVYDSILDQTSAYGKSALETGDSSLICLKGYLHNFSGTSWVNPINSLHISSQGQIVQDNLDIYSPESDLSISAWLKPDGSDATSIYTLLEKSTGYGVDHPSFEGVRVELIPQNNDEYIIKAGVSTSGTNSYAISSPQIISSSIWHNIVVNFDKGNGLQIYLDSIQITIDSSQSPTSDNINLPDTNSLIGDTVRSGDPMFFSGEISMVTIYNRLLTTNEIIQGINNPYLIQSSAILSIPFNEGKNHYARDIINPYIYSKLTDTSSWKEDYAIHNGTNKPDHSTTLSLDYSKGSYIDFGPVLTTNQNIALETTFAAKTGASNYVRIMDYGFGDSANSGAKFAIDVLNTGALKVYISDGDVSEPSNIETFETSENQINEGEFHTVIFMYNDDEQQFDIYINDILILSGNTSFTMNSFDNHGMHMRAQGPDGFITFRSIKLATSNDIYGIDLLNQNRILDVPFTEGAGNILYNKDKSIAGDIVNTSQWGVINKLYETYTSNSTLDISNTKLSKIYGTNLMLNNYTDAKIPYMDNELRGKDFAIEFWFSIDTQDGTYPLLEKGRSIVGDSLIDNTFLLYIEDGILNGWITGQNSTLSDTIENSKLNINQNYHFILQKSSELGMIDLWYYNGSTWIKYWNSITTNKKINSKSDILIGQSKSIAPILNTKNSFAGIIDEIRILNRSYKEQEFIDNDISISSNDLSMSIPVNSILESNDLISRFSFNDNRTDILRDNIHKTYPTDGQIHANLIQFFNNGINFDGSSWGVVNDGDGINLNGSEYTLEVWLKIDDISNNQTIFRKDGPSGVNYSLKYDADDGFIFSIDNKDVNSGIEDIKAGVPYYIALVYDKSSSNKIKIYIDGSLKNETSLDESVISSNNSDLIIGANTNSSDDNNFIGSIYQLRFWNTAMSFNAITEHAMDPFTYAGELDRSQVLSEWLFEEESDLIFKNSITNDLNGTLYTENSIPWGYDEKTGYFNGENNYITIDNSNEDYDFSNGTDYTFETWLKYDPEKQIDEIGTIISNGDPINSEQGFLLGVRKSTDQIIFKVSDGTSEGSREVASRNLINDDKEHHVLVTYDAYDSDKIYLYIDSKLEDEISVGSISLTNNNELVTIGATSDENKNIDHLLSGNIDEIRVLDTYLEPNIVTTEYIGGADSINSVPYSITVTNNTDIDINGLFYIYDLLPPYLIINEDINIFSSPSLYSNPTIVGDLISGYQYTFPYYFNNTVLSPNENISLNFYAKLDPTYEDISGEKLSELQIVYDIDPIDKSFASTIMVKNISGSEINGGNTIEQGEQGYIQVKYINDTTETKYPLIVGYQENTSLMFNNSTSSNSISLTDSHAPLSLEPPTINSEIQDSGEYIRAFKRASPYPSLELESLIESNNFNKYFYSVAGDNLRLQWNLKDDPSSIDGFRYKMFPTYNIDTLSDCSTNDASCIGSPQNQSTYNFWSGISADNYSDRRWKRQDSEEDFTLNSGNGEFGESYYFLYATPPQGKNEFHIRVRDHLLQWGDTRKIDLWFDSYKPISQLSLTGTNYKIKDPVSPTDWWRESVNSTFTVQDDITHVHNNEMDLVSGIDYIDFYFYNTLTQTHDPNIWNRVYDNSAGGGGIISRWSFEDTNNILTDGGTAGNSGTINYTIQSNFWDTLTPGAGHFGNSGEENYVSFIGDIFDLTSNFTIETWVSFDNLNDQVIVSKWDDRDNKSYKLTIEDDGEIHLYTSANGYTTIHSKSNGANIQTGTEYFIAVAKDGTEQHYYINGSETGSLYNSAPNQYNSNKSFFIGKEDKEDTSYLKGTIDELRIYNRALTLDEISTHNDDGKNGVVTSEVDNNITIGEISTESSIADNGSYNIDFRAEDKATPANATSSTYSIKIDKIRPTSQATIFTHQNTSLGENGWYKGHGQYNSGIIGASFEVYEGITTSSIYNGSGLKKMNFVHTINGADKDNFTIDWNASSYLKSLLGFIDSTSSGHSSYTGANTVNEIISCNDGNSYPLVINGHTISVWIGGCDYSLTGVELAKMIRTAINGSDYDSVLDDYYNVTYASNLFTIESIGDRGNDNVSAFSYANGKYSLNKLFTENSGYTTEGTHDLYFWAIDNAGNIENLINHIQFKIDTAPPVCPYVDTVNERPNAWAFEPSDTGELGTYRDLELIDYVQDGYNKSAIDDTHLLEPNSRHDIKSPMFMWPKTNDYVPSGGIQDINYSGDVHYGYVWDPAEGSDFDSSGDIVITEPHTSNPWSIYRSIGTFDIANTEQILDAHRGVLMPSGSVSGSGDDIPNPEITDDDDGKFFFLWLRVKDKAGNENLCGQPGGTGVRGPFYIFSYGKAKRFTTKELYNDNQKYIEISGDKDNPTKFAAGPFIAGEEIKFDQLYFKPTDSSTADRGSILNPGEGSYADNQIVHLVDRDRSLSVGQTFTKIGSSPDGSYPSVKITGSMNPYRKDITDWNDGEGYFEKNDFYIGIDNGEVIKTGPECTGYSEEPPPLSEGCTVGRFQNFGIAKGPRAVNGDILPGVVSVSSTSVISTQNILDDPLSKSSLENPEIIRGFTNISGRYELRIAIMDDAEQYIEIHFDILPAAPNLDCADGMGECTKLKLNKP